MERKGLALTKKKVPLGWFGTKFKLLMEKLSAFGGAILRRFQEGYEYGKQQQANEANQKITERTQEIIERNQQAIESANALLEKVKKQREDEKASEHNDSSHLERVCEMSFFIGDNAPVHVQMSHPFWDSLQDQHHGAWNTVLKFVDKEIERRKTEDV